jgi:hypothetical protein
MSLNSHVVDLLINLLAAAICVAVGWLSRRAVERARTRHAKTVWRPFLDHPLVVIAAFNTFKDSEPSGFIGLGDAVAWAELHTLLSSLTVTGLEVTYADRIRGDQLQRNIILLGGPEGNSVTADAMRRLTLTLRFTHGGKISDSVTGDVYSPEISQDGEVERDLALIIRDRNPFAPDRELLIVGGSFGYGTWGGVRFLLRNSSQLQKPTHAEQVVVCDVAYHTPQTTKLVLSRELKS